MKYLIIVLICGVLGYVCAVWDWHTIIAQQTPYVQVLQARGDRDAHSILFEEATNYIPIGLMVGCLIAFFVNQSDSKKADQAKDSDIRL